MTGNGAFCDFLPTPQIGKNFFPCIIRFFSGTGAIRRHLCLSPRFSMPAERMVMGELTKRKWSGHDLAARRKGDAEKLVIAERLRRETTMPLAWIAARLQMRTPTHLSHLLYWRRREKT